jgi:hypothetical protein
MMLHAMKIWLLEISKDQRGTALLLTVIMMFIGSLLILPSLSFISTSVKTGEMIENNLRGLYAAESGIEDAIWRMENDTPASFPFSYQLSDVNKMMVNVTIEEVTTIAGKEVVPSGVHSEDLLVTKATVYSSGIYYYTLTVTNNGEGNVKVEMILIDFPPGLEYVAGSTGGDLYNDDPVVVGDAMSGITIYWEFIPPYPTVPEGTSRQHTFQLNGPAGINNPEGHAAVRASRQDIGVIWDVDSRPYSISAEAIDTDSNVVSTIRVGLWGGINSIISCWQVNP